MTSEPVASSRERLPGVLLGPSRSGKVKQEAGQGRWGGGVHFTRLALVLAGREVMLTVLLEGDDA